MRPNAPQVMETQRPPRHTRNIGLSGHPRARANIIEARFGQVGYLCTHPPVPGGSSRPPFDVRLS